MESVDGAAARLHRCVETEIISACETVSLQVLSKPHFQRLESEPKIAAAVFELGGVVSKGGLSLLQQRATELDSRDVLQPVTPMQAAQAALTASALRLERLKDQLRTLSTVHQADPSSRRIEKQWNDAKAQQVIDTLSRPELQCTDRSVAVNR